jgi:hypothetical protein
MRKEVIKIDEKEGRKLLENPEKKIMLSWKRMMERD